MDINPLFPVRAMKYLHYLSEGHNIFKRRLKIARKGIKRYIGNAKEICKQIIERCWNGEYFQVSAGHFNEFYMRDFGWCVDSLMKLGYKEKVHKTLAYVLSVYSKSGLKTTITHNKKAIDVFSYAPDSLAYLIRSLRVAKAGYLINKYKHFLAKEINLFFKNILIQKHG